ncbi:CRAL-TRIO domain-containing protein [Crucibulum laeve]|uniref:CRAL-TRIO domain-containing protein n=1 Tax=Crucibulum laeve TaxID=68775 RepID=A0A5C3MAG3_9AGAR|nr:CRAL-TRIO domain-containing protein [Crucibulum laeve]
MPQTHEEILTTFRQELFAEDILHEGDSIGTDDETLLRFLRARNYDLRQSKVMFKNCQEWRKTVEGVGIDQLYKDIDPFDASINISAGSYGLLERYPEREAVFDCWPMWFHKTDKKGRPLNIHFFGGMDLPKLYQTCTPEKHWQTVLVNAESLAREVLPAAARAAGKEIGTTLVIVDLQGFGIRQFWQMKSLARSSFQISQDYYPETMGQLAIVNAPTSFTAIWAMIRPWLSAETAAKVDILGSNYKNVLLDLVDAENLPSSLGGECTCEEAGGCHLSGVGPWLDGRVGWGPKAEREREVGAEVKQEMEADKEFGKERVLGDEKAEVKEVGVVEMDKGVEVVA